MWLPVSYTHLKADLQEVEKYLPHLRGCSFREEVALALPKVKNVEELARECAMSVNTRCV